jgi:hypothetical protein
MLNTSCYLDYTFTKGILRYKNIIVISKGANLREWLVSLVYDSYIQDYARIHNSYKRLKSMLK